MTNEKWADDGEDVDCKPHVVSWLYICLKQNDIRYEIKTWNKFYYEVEQAFNLISIYLSFLIFHFLFFQDRIQNLVL